MDRLQLLGASGGAAFAILALVAYTINTGPSSGDGLTVIEYYSSHGTATAWQAALPLGVLGGHPQTKRRVGEERAVRRWDGLQRERSEPRPDSPERSERSERVTVKVRPNGASAASE